MVFRPVVSTPVHIAIIGAGLSGLIAARTLADNGHRVRVFEKARGPGGRMATRRIDSIAFDHGAQYFTVRDERFKLRVDSWMQSGLVRPWKASIRVIRRGDIRRENRPQERFVGIPGMSAIARQLAESLETQWDTRVSQVHQDMHRIVLVGANGDRLDTCDALIVSAPPEQGCQLLQGLTPLVDQMSAVRMDPCWAVMLAFDRPLELPCDGAFIHDSEVAWAARNSSKPRRDAKETWVLHAASEWSATHLNAEPQDVIRHLTASFFTALGVKSVAPSFATTHRWRYARARNPLNIGCLWDQDAGIGVCGDWCCKSRIEGAYLSGAAMAGRILATLAHLR